MKEKTRFARAFAVTNTAFLTFVAVLCLAPMVHLLSMSLSGSSAVLSGRVSFWPVSFTTAAYQYMVGESKFWNALSVTLLRLLVGVPLNMILVVLVAYPLSKEVAKFKARTAYAWFFAVTMFFNGGLIPTYMVVKLTGLMDTVWALVLPTALNVWFAVMLLNFFRGVPKELEEAAIMDGAGHLQILARIYLPVSLPAIATILLFISVGHWNSWFDGYIYMNSPRNYPLQTYLSTLVRQAELTNRRAFTDADLARYRDLSNKTVKIAQIFMGTVPILLVYPFLQRYFIKGIVIGSVKG